MDTLRFLRQSFLALLTAAALAQQSGGPQNSTFEGQPAITLANDKVRFTVMVEGSAIASATLNDDPEKLNPLWNPLKLARDSGRQAQYTGTLGHLACAGRPFTGRPHG